jgi:hypothetical protein
MTAIVPRPNWFGWAFAGKSAGFDTLPATKQAKHFAVLAIAPVVVDDPDGPDRGGNPSHQRQLKAQAERRLEGSAPQQQGKPGKQDGNGNHSDPWRRRMLATHPELCLLIGGPATDFGATERCPT